MNTKTLIQSRTFWVAAATFVAGLLTLVSSTFVDYLSPEVTGYILLILGAVNAFLRYNTSAEITGVVSDK